mgnify:CR=1 FL=1
MNNDKWRELQEAVKKLPFPPPYQLKLVDSEYCSPEAFGYEMSYWGDWSDEAMAPFHKIEWIRVQPVYKKHRGILIDDETVDETCEFRTMLKEHSIPYEEDNGAIIIYGYRQKKRGRCGFLKKDSLYY